MLSPSPQWAGIEAEGQRGGSPGTGKGHRAQEHGEPFHSLLSFSAFPSFLWSPTPGSNALWISASAEPLSYTLSPYFSMLFYICGVKILFCPVYFILLFYKVNRHGYQCRPSLSFSQTDMKKYRLKDVGKYFLNHKATVFVRNLHHFTQCHQWK